jgi:hypothetical protein
MVPFPAASSGYPLYLRWVATSSDWLHGLECVVWFFLLTLWDEEYFDVQVLRQSETKVYDCSGGPCRSSGLREEWGRCWFPSL